MSKDWRDGFLFVGNQLSLDFLNTRPVIDGKQVELLPDSASLLRWLAAAGLLTKKQVGHVVPSKADPGLPKLREFRETWRRVVLQLEAEDAFGPLLDDMVSLVTTADRSRIRKCASCVLHFHDTSKKGTRRWCSMQLCGNRLKVAAYAARRRRHAHER